MSEWIWLNGEIMPMSEARIGVEDRGFQFADGVYEVIRVYGGRLFTLAEHLDRLERSCAAIRIRLPLAKSALAREIARLTAIAAIGEGMIYLQITRGAAPRNHAFTTDLEPTLLFYARPLPAMPAAGQVPGTRLHSVPDERWKKCWIKSIALLPNILAKTSAVEAGADEAVFIDDGMVTECSASNFFAVIDGAVVTHPVGAKVLPGITRLVLVGLARELGIAFIERPLSVDEARSAKEIFITSTTRELNWVSQWNGQTLATKCGDITLALHRAYQSRVAAEIAKTVAA